MKLSVIVNSKERSEVDVSDLVFGREVNTAVVHQVVTAYLANQRIQSYRSASNVASKLPMKKNRAAVSGGGRKPRPQKGSGRARAGTIRSPLFVGGGMTFGSSKANYFQKINKKMYRLAMCSILSGLRSESRVVVASVNLEDHKTKTLLTWLKDHNIEKKALIVVPDLEENLLLAARNLQNVVVVLPDELNPVLLLKYDMLVIHPDAISEVEESFV
ncbi:MAG: 50S ribosomal protein L4 [Gammaproteobacteria bacterium]|nr:50S ribosomal protein L4 [Gammaproteobacteria bacterium]